MKKFFTAIVATAVLGLLSSGPSAWARGKKPMQLAKPTTTNGRTTRRFAKSERERFFTFDTVCQPTLGFDRTIANPRSEGTPTIPSRRT